jgi:hypothetical protein
VLDGKIKTRVCIKFCVKPGKSTAKTLEMLREAFGENSLCLTDVYEWRSLFKAGQVSVEMTNVQCDQAPAERQEMLKNSRTRPQKALPNNP